MRSPFPGGSAMPMALVDMFDQVLDPRHPQGRVHDLGPMLALAVVAMLAGRTTLQGIAQLTPIESAIQVAEHDGGIFIPAPVAVAVSVAVANQVSVAWQPVIGATLYEVSYATSPTGDYAVVGYGNMNNTTATLTDLPVSTTLYLRVRAQYVQLAEGHAVLPLWGEYSHPVAVPLGGSPSAIGPARSQIYLPVINHQ